MCSKICIINFAANFYYSCLFASKLRQNIPIWANRMNFIPSISDSAFTIPLNVIIRKSDGTGNFPKNLMNANPLTEPNDDRLGPRFPDMSKPYCKPAIETALRLAGEEGVRCQTGIYSAVKGPCFETPAECRFIRLIGADAIGMSTIPEVIAANHLGMEVFAFSVITDLAIEGQMSEVSHEEVLKAAQNAEPGVSRVVRRLLRDWCSSPS
jgi:hypothetical protein